MIFSGFGSDPHTSKYEVYATVPKIIINGKYKIDGRVLLLPIKGDGDAHLELDNMSLNVIYKPKVIVKKGKEYIQTEKFKLDFDTQQLHMKLENLFNGDKILSENMNTFLNENWRDILKELKPSISFAIEEIFKSIINRVFIKVPYDELFLPN